VKKALEGLPGVERVEWDLARDLVRVTGASAEAVIAKVRDLKYDATVADGRDFSPGGAHPTGLLPPAVRKAIDRAKAEGKRALFVDCATES